MKTLAILLGEHPCIVNIVFGPMTVHYREVLLYIYSDMEPKWVTLPSLAVYGELTFHQFNHSGCRFCTIFYLTTMRCTDPN